MERYGDDERRRDRTQDGPALRVAAARGHLLCRCAVEAKQPLAASLNALRALARSPSARRAPAASPYLSVDTVRRRFLHLARGAATRPGASSC